ncbi:hypothetical protein LMB96_00430 [Limosilactobacillus reuteri]|uniref:hypothetical protein n=1 Tax=Limosilactobacillus reuteri TaxID=1598 RepID=UPI001E37E3A5|nr:hypothetical protein [Limosilactobacillus reuteri]MCC4420857.1 hypothetical protein [Limosilactobacillus reuteri]
MTEIKINDELAQQAESYFAKQGLDLTEGIALLLRKLVDSQSEKDFGKLIQQYHEGDPEVVNSLNTLFEKLNKQSHNTQKGIGNAILGEHHHPSSTNGIGNNLLR